MIASTIRLLRLQARPSLALLAQGAGAGVRYFGFFVASCAWVCFLNWALR